MVAFPVLFNSTCKSAVVPVILIADWPSKEGRVTGMGVAKFLPSDQEVMLPWVVRKR